MRKNLLLLFLLFLFLAGCQSSSVTPSPVSSQPWQIQVVKFELKPSLNSVETVSQYNGTKINVTHTQNPDAGFLFLILNVTIRKTDNNSIAPFEWQSLVIKDASGNFYPRLVNDTFLEQYQFIPRMTGLELRFGENTGWMAFEIPASVATGRLSLAYTVPGNQLQLVLQK
jgi:hypothetical protein